MEKSEGFKNNNLFAYRERKIFQFSFIFFVTLNIKCGRIKGSNVGVEYLPKFQFI